MPVEGSGRCHPQAVKERVISLQLGLHHAQLCTNAAAQLVLTLSEASARSAQGDAEE